MEGKHGRDVADADVSDVHAPTSRGGFLNCKYSIESLAGKIAWGPPDALDLNASISIPVQRQLL